MVINNPLGKKKKERKTLVIKLETPRKNKTGETQKFKEMSYRAQKQAIRLHGKETRDCQYKV